MEESERNPPIKKRSQVFKREKKTGIIYIRIFLSGEFTTNLSVREKEKETNVNRERWKRERERKKRETKD